MTDVPLFSATYAGLLKPGIRVENHASSGQSSRSFMASLWPKVHDRLKAGDFLIIQFGHNDQPGKPGRSTDLATAYRASGKRFRPWLDIGLSVRIW